MAYERRYNPKEPLVDLESYVELFVQSLQLDVSELMESEEEVQYPVQCETAHDKDVSAWAGATLAVSAEQHG